MASHIFERLTGKTGRRAALEARRPANASAAITRAEDSDSFTTGRDLGVAAAVGVRTSLGGGMEKAREFRDCDQDVRLFGLPATPTRLASAERLADFGSKQAPGRDFRDCSQSDCKADGRSGSKEVS